MSVFGTSKFLGLALRDRAILAAEVRLSGDQATVTRTAEFAFPPELAWEKPAALGSAVRRFLRQNHFSASHAVAGVPAKWLMARQKDIPPATEQIAAAALRMQAEREFSPELKDLVFDYAGNPDARKAQKVLLVAMQRQQLDGISEMADEAGLSLTVVTSSTLALASRGDGKANGDLSLVVMADSAELAVGSTLTPRALKYLPVSGLGNGHAAEGMVALGSELQRTVMLMSGGGDGSAPRLMLWDSIGMDPSAATTLAERSGLEVRRGDLGPLGVRGGLSDEARTHRFSGAIALAMTGLRPQLRSIDLLHPRLAAPKKRRISQRTKLIAAITVAVLGCVGYLVVDNQRGEARLADLNAQLKQMQPKVDEAKALRDKLIYARGWFDLRPGYLECLRELTTIMPGDGRIWATNLTIKDTGKCVLVGTAMNHQAWKDLERRLKENKRFSEVQMMDVREKSAKTHELTFTINFVFKMVEQP